MTDKPSYLNFDKQKYAWKPDIDYRKHPAKYHVGKGEQGVLICEPFKSEMTPHWRFKTEDIAKQSSTHLYKMFLSYLKNDEFVGADMARKFLQMGFTRARRYANYRGGKKYDKEHDYALLEKGTGDPEKAKAAAVFYDIWQKAEENPEYKTLKIQWKAERG
jgi:hypothetical protein